MIVITLESGSIQNISTDDPKLVGAKVVVIDYDAAVSDLSEISKIPQGNGKTEDAVIGRHEVGMLYEPVADFLKAKA